MRRPLLLLAALAAPLLAAPGARAQLVVTRSSVEALLASAGSVTSFDSDTTTATRAHLQGLADRVGAGQTWTFSGPAYTAGASYRYTPVAAPQPGSDDPHFAQGNLIVRTDSMGTTDVPGYGFYRLDGAGLTALGSAFLAPDGTFQKYKQTPGVFQPLPYTYGSAWSSSTDLVFEPAPLPMDGSVHEESEVVGWGTLVTPGGSAPALMIRSLIVSKWTYLFPGVPSTTEVDSAYAVNYFTEGRLAASIYLDRDGRALSGSYTAPVGATPVEGGGAPGRPLALHVGPNPARRGPVEVRLTLPEAGAASVRVYDALGREVAVLADGPLPAGPQRLTWDAAAVPAGLYVVRARAGADTDVRRLVVE